MKILYVGAFRMPNLDAAAPRVLNIARSLHEAGHKVSFISWGGEQRDQDRGVDGIYRVDGFPYIITNELPQPGESSIGRIRSKILRGKKTKKLLFEWPEQIDAIITYNNCLSSWLIPFCGKRGIKLINDLTEWYSYSELKPSDWPGYVYDMFCRQKRVKNKIVISSYLDRFYSMTHNIVVPATCDASESKWHQNLDYARAIVKPFNGVTLIYAGTPARKDQIHHVVNAVQSLAEEGMAIRFLMVGTTRDSYMSRYASVLRNKNLHENIIFLGRVSQDVIPSFYYQADFMVLLREQTRKSNAGFPTKFTESFISGTPVIANLTSDLGLYLKDGETGFVVEEPNENAIYRILKEKVLLLSRSEIKNMKQNVKVVAKQFDYHTFVKPLRDFMNNLK